MQGGILSRSAAAPLTKILRTTEILVENPAFLSHFGLEKENLSGSEHIHFLSTEIIFLSRINSFQNQNFLPKELLPGIEHTI